MNSIFFPRDRTLTAQVLFDTGVVLEVGESAQLLDGAGVYGSITIGPDGAPVFSPVEVS